MRLCFSIHIAFGRNLNNIQCRDNTGQHTLLHDEYYAIENAAVSRLWGVVDICLMIVFLYCALNILTPLSHHRQTKTRSFKIMKFQMTDIIDQAGFEQRLKAYTDSCEIGTSDYNSKLYICGPEYDEMGSGYDSDDGEGPKSVPEDHVKQMFMAFSALPFLEIAIDPAYYSSNEGSVETSRICWLLSSKECKVETLRISSLEVKTQADVESLAVAFKNCPSIKALCVDQLHVGYRDVKTIVPIMEALAQLPNLTKVRIVIDAFDNVEATKRYANESLPVLKKGPGLGDVDIMSNPRSAFSFGYNRYNPELSNCVELNAYI